MTEAQYRRAERDVIYLAGCAVNQEKPDMEKINDTEAVYDVSARHMLTAVVATALQSAGANDKRCIQAAASALRKAILYERTYEQLKAELENAGIWYLPLKGMLLKDYYPRYGIREMADYDILFDADRTIDVKAIMEGLGFRANQFGESNHDCYFKDQLLNFEMHRALFSPVQEDGLYTYYQDIQRHLLGDGCEKHLSPEDFYLYITAHEYKHYSDGGTGLRSLLDTYVYLWKETLDMAYVAAEAEKIGIAAFEAANRSLAMRLFGGEKLTKSDQEMLDYIFASGTYGTITHRVENRMRRHAWSKGRYALNRFLVPFRRKNKDYDAYAIRYPFFYQHRVFLPLLPFYRVYNAIKSGRFQKEAEAARHVPKNTDR